MPWSEQIGGMVSSRLILILIFAFATLLILYNGSILVPERGDQAMWDYMAQAVVRGQVPYRDVVNIKTPLSAYISSAGILVGKAIGLNQLIAIRYLGLVTAGLLLVLTFAVTEAYTGNRVAATLSALAPLTLERYYYAASAGTEPKLPMILFGMLALLLIQKNRPFWAGLASMLSCLCWQPGLLFTGTAVLVFSRYLRSWRDLRAARALAGASLPLVVLIAYFYHGGGLADLWKWCFVFDLTSYAPSAYKGLAGQLDHIGTVIGRSLGRPGIVLLAVGAAGYLMFLIQWIRRPHEAGRMGRKPPVSDSTGAILIAPLVYLVYLRFDFNAWPYLIPVIPFAAIFAGWLAATLIEMEQSLFKSPAPGHSRATVRYAGVIVSALLVCLAIWGSAASKYHGTTLEDEYILVQPLEGAFEPGDTIWAQGEVNVLVLLDRPNASKYIWFDRGKDDFAARDATGGFQEILSEIESNQPRFVATGRMDAVHHKDEIAEWLAAHYSLFPILGFEVYIRR